MERRNLSQAYLSQTYTEFKPVRMHSGHTRMMYAAYRAKIRAETDEKCGHNLRAANEYLKAALILLKAGKTRRALSSLNMAIDNYGKVLKAEPDAFADWKNLGEAYVVAVNLAMENKKRATADRAYEVFFGAAEKLENSIKDTPDKVLKNNQKYEPDGKFRLLGLLYGFAGDFAPEDNPQPEDFAHSSRSWAYASSLIYYIKHGADYEGIIKSFRKIDKCDPNLNYKQAAFTALLDNARLLLEGASHDTKGDLKIAAKICGYAWEVFGKGDGFEDSARNFRD